MTDIPTPDPPARQVVVQTKVTADLHAQISAKAQSLGLSMQAAGLAALSSWVTAPASPPLEVAVVPVEVPVEVPVAVAVPVKAPRGMDGAVVGRAVLDPEVLR